MFEGGTTHHDSDYYIVKNGVLQDGLTWTKDSNSLAITASSGSQYFLDNAGNGSRGYIQGVQTRGYKYLKIDCRLNSGNGVSVCGSTYPLGENYKRITSSRATYTFDITSTQPCIGGWNGSWATEVYNIYLSDNP